MVNGIAILVGSPQIHDGHGTDECASCGGRKRAAHVGELHVVGVDTSPLQGEINENGEGIVQYVRQNR